MFRFVGVCVFFVSLSCHCATAYFSLPPVTILVFKNRSLSISIPHVEHLEFFSIQGKLNHYVGKSTKPTKIPESVANHIDGKWIIRKSDLIISPNDEIIYRVYVEHDGIGYYKKHKTYKVEGYFDENSYIQDNILPCPLSKTTIDGDGPTCKGSVIFEDDFDGEIDPSLWTVEHRLPYEHERFRSMFVTFQNSNVKIRNGKLEIFPTLLKNLGWDNNKILIGEIDLTESCTTSSIKFCSKIFSTDNNIVPPVVTGKISTKDKFSFKYGTVEVKAKFPNGVWLFPEMYLEPVKLSGSYQDRVIRIGFSIGNDYLAGVKNPKSIVSGGVFFRNSIECLTKNNKNPQIWSSKTHTYKMIWDSDKIELYVDEDKYGTIVYSKCQDRYDTIINLLQEEYFLSFGVGVGGLVDFPDYNYKEKPWKNTATKAREEFFNASSSFSYQWNPNDIRFEVESVKIYAI